MTNNLGTLNTNEYSLSIRVCSDGFFLAMSDFADKILVSRHIPIHVHTLSSSDIISLFESERGLLESDYNDVRIIVESNYFVFVPDVLFDLQELDTYFYFQHKQNKNDVVLFNRITAWETINIFSLPIALNEALNELFPDCIITHQLTQLLARIDFKKDSISVWVREQMLDLVVMKNGKFTLANSFAYRTAEDFTYYVLSVVEQLGMNVEETTITLYQKDKRDDFRNLLSEYVKHCEVVLQ